MTHAAGMGPLPALLEAASGRRAVRRVFQTNRLPLEIASNPDLRLPLASLVSTFESAGIEAGERCFGLRVGQQMAPQNFGAWAAYSVSAATLGEALQRFVRGLRVFQAGADSLLHSSGDRITWSYRRPYRQTGGIQHADHVLPPMIQLVRAYLGSDWFPQLVHVCYPRDAAAQQLELRLGTSVRFNMPGIAVIFEKADLAARRTDPVSIEEQLTFSDVLALSGGERDGTVEAVRDILDLTIMRGESDLEGTAQLAGIGPRSLQRQLRSEGTSYRRLLEQVRMRRAMGLLRETAEPVGSIAFALGYREPANFSRAFRRVTGHAPQRYRQGVADDAFGQDGSGHRESPRE